MLTLLLGFGNYFNFGKRGEQKVKNNQQFKPLAFNSISINFL